MTYSKLAIAVALAAMTSLAMASDAMARGNGAGGGGAGSGVGGAGGFGGDDRGRNPNVIYNFNRAQTPGTTTRYLRVEQHNDRGGACGHREDILDLFSTEKRCKQ